VPRIVKGTMAVANYWSVHHCADTEDKIPPSLPLEEGGIPLFGKEGLGEIFKRIYLFNHGLLSKQPCTIRNQIRLRVQFFWDKP
jgi:hypothetical protein